MPRLLTSNHWRRSKTQMDVHNRSLLFRVFMLGVEMQAGKKEGTFNGILTLIQTNRQMHKVGNQVGDFTAAYLVSLPPAFEISLKNCFHSPGAGFIAGHLP
jgi:hypothetical protein